MNAKKIRVLVVDDSATVRSAISKSLNRDPEIEVVGTAIDPYVARDKILEVSPDVITLDVEMPRMDGITFLKILMKHRPMPVIIISAITKSGSERAMEALQAGAVEVIGKPDHSFSIGDLGEQLAEKVKIAAKARMRPKLHQSATPEPPQRQLTSAATYHPRRLILLGASTGGTEALKEVLTRLPGGLPGICIVQHIPPVFSKAFADRLNGLCDFEVREAVDGDLVTRNLALIAPGGFHMLLRSRSGQYSVRLTEGPFVHHQRPAVDVLFGSATDCVGKYGVVGLLTGMGKDGALGMQRLKNAGSPTIAQNEETCVVYGMPRAAVELGAANHVLPLEKIPAAIVKLASGTENR